MFPAGAFRSGAFPEPADVFPEPLPSSDGLPIQSRRASSSRTGSAFSGEAVLTTLTHVTRAALVSATLAVTAEVASAQTVEYGVKAAFLYKFTRFVEWPETGACPDGSVTIAILGRDPFGRTIDRTVEGRPLGDRRVRVLRLARPEDVPACSLLWLGRDEATRVEAVGQQLRGVAVVLVGDAAGFANRGGTIGLVVENDRVALEVNLTALAPGITISSRLLGVARVIQPNRPSGSTP